MKTKSLAISALAGVFLVSLHAMASPIPITGILSIGGSDLYSNTLNSITFVPGTGQVGGVSTGTLSVFTNTNPVTMNSFFFGSAFVPGTILFTTTEAGITASLTLETLTSSITPANGLTINGMGLLSETGYAATMASFNLTTQDGGDDKNTVTFSATTIPVAPTPEPTSIALLGTGLLGIAGLARRRMIA